MGLPSPNFVETLDLNLQTSDSDLFLSSAASVSGRPTPITRIPHDDLSLSPLQDPQFLGGVFVILLIAVVLIAMALGIDYYLYRPRRGHRSRKQSIQLVELRQTIEPTKSESETSRTRPQPVPDPVPVPVAVA